MEKITSVEEYLAGLPAEQRAALDKLRATIRAAAPDATEGISYAMAAFKFGTAGWSATRRSRITTACSR